MTKAPRTWEDVERMPDDGNRYEWIGGRLYMTPAPVTRHQRISKQPGHERFTGELPVRFGTELLGMIDLDEVFSRHLDLWEDSPD